jgi:hypothetical protein
MADLVKQSEAAVGKLMQAEESQLYEQLGMRVEAVAADVAKAGSLEPQVTYERAEMGLKDDVRELGRQLFERWQKEAHKLVCSATAAEAKDRQRVLDAFGVSEVAVGASLSAGLISLGLAPALAPVVAALVVKRFFRPTYEEFCAFWAKHLPPGAA